MQNNFEFLDNVINTISDPIFVKNDKHILVLVNNAYCDFLGISKEKVLGKNDYNFFPKEQVDIFWAKDNEVIVSEKINSNEEKITNTKGEVRRIITIKSIFENKKGKKYIVGIIRDIEDIKRIKEVNEGHLKEIEEINKKMMVREVEMSEIKKNIDKLKIKLINSNITQ